MDDLLIDLLNDVDALITMLHEPQVPNSDYAKAVNEAVQLYSKVHAAMQGPKGVGPDEVRRWRGHLVALSSRLAQYPNIDTLYAPYVLAGAADEKTVPTSDENVEDRWQRDAGQLAGTSASGAQRAGTSLPGDPVSEPDPKDLPTRRDKS